MTARHYFYSSAALAAVLSTGFLLVRHDGASTDPSRGLVSVFAPPGKRAVSTAQPSTGKSSMPASVASHAELQGTGESSLGSFIAANPEWPPRDLASAYISEGRKAILPDGTFDPEFWTAFSFTPEQREATQKRWDRALWIASHAEKRFMTEPLTAEGSVTFTIEPSPDTGAAVRKKLLADFAGMMPPAALQYLASQGGLAEDAPVFGASGRNRREFRVTQSGGSLQVHENQYTYSTTGGWVLVSDFTNTFQGIPPRFVHLFEQAKP